MSKNCGNPNRAFINLTSFHRAIPEEISIYTDGSKFSKDEEGNFVGAAFWIPSFNIVKGYKLNHVSSSFSAEAIAVIRALEFAFDKNLMAVNICTDSLSLLQALKNKQKRKYRLCPLIDDIKYSVYKLKQHNSLFRIKLTWCPAHVGVAGNERADKEAKEAAESGISINNKVDYNQLISSLKVKYLELDKEFLSYLNIKAGKDFFRNFSEFDIKFFRGLSLLSRESSVIIRLVTGYAYTGYYLYRIGVRNSPACECGSKIQDINHIFLSCNLFENQRRLLFKNLINLKVFPPYSMISLLSILDDKIAKIIIKFVHNSKINI